MWKVDLFILILFHLFTMNVLLYYILWLLFVWLIVVWTLFVLFYGCIVSQPEFFDSSGHKSKKQTKKFECETKWSKNVYSSMQLLSFCSSATLVLFIFRMIILLLIDLMLILFKIVLRWDSQTRSFTIFRWNLARIFLKI